MKVKCIEMVDSFGCWNFESGKTYTLNKQGNVVRGNVGLPLAVVREGDTYIGSTMEGIVAIFEPAKRNKSSIFKWSETPTSNKQGAIPNEKVS